MHPLAVPLVLVGLAWASLDRAAFAQCPLVFSSSGPQPQLSGSTQCSILWDPDGAGPAAERLVVGGGSLTAGNTPSSSVMTWDGSQWEGLGVGPGEVRSLAVWNGQLVAGGSFGGGAGTNHVAVWNGSAWQQLGTGFPHIARAVAVWNGNLVAAKFTNTGSSVPPVIQQWNGVAWSSLPNTPSLTFVSEIVSFQGLLCVGGANPTGGGVLERWNGTSWLPSINANGIITSLKVRSFSLISSLYVGGTFSHIGGVSAPFLASTSGGTSFPWSAIAPALPASCSALHVRPTSALNSAIVVNLGNSAHDVVQWSAGAWVPMGNGWFDSFTYYGGSLYGVLVPGGNGVCQRYDGTAWVTVRGAGIDGDVHAAARLGNDTIVGGTFSSTASGAMPRIARWNGTTFHALGSGIAGTSVDALLPLGDEQVVAGGLFIAAGGAGAGNIARWNGTAWTPLGTGVNQQVLALCRLPNGDVVAGGRFATAGGVACARIARWNGSAWSPLGAGMNGDVQALAVRGDGVLFAGGAFTVAGGVACSRVAQWDGAAWLPVGTGCNNDVLGLAVRTNGDVVAVGSFTSAGGSSADRCARWTGTAWTSMGTASVDPSPVRAVVALPNGHVVVSHGFHTPTFAPDEGLSRWNGNTWSAIGVIRTHYLCCTSSSPVVRTLAQRADGDVIVGGSFSLAGGLVSHSLAAFASTCMPLATAYGAGCASAAGPLVLAADTLPWVGATVRTTTTGIAPVSLCLAVTGFSQVSIPLPSILAQGQPGCTVLASPDMLDVLLPDATGTVHTALALANTPSLLGASFFQQSIPLEFTAQMALVAVRASNALALTIGTL